MAKEQSYTIYWESLISNEKGCGTDSFTYEIANSWIDMCNKRYPHIKHYIKEA